MAKAYEIPGLRLSLLSATELDRYVAVTVNAEGQAVLPTDGGVIAGVTMENVPANAVVGVATAGVVFGHAVSIVNAGELVAVDAAGKFRKANGSSDKEVGLCVAGAKAGEICSVLLK